MAAIPISTAFGAVVSIAIIQYLDGLFGLAGWRVMFLLEGVPVVLLAGVVLWFLTDRPSQATWMPRAERDALECVLESEEQSVGQHSPRSVLATLRDPRVLALAWVYFGIAYGLYALGFFLPTIISGLSEQFGTTYRLLDRGLITAVPYGVALVGLLLWTRRVSNPTVRVAIPALIGGLSIPVALYLTKPVLAMIAVTICACGVITAVPNFWALPTAYLTGAAAAAGIALINSLANLSGFIAPYVTGALSDATGSHRAGLCVVGVCMVSAAAVVWGLAARRKPRSDRDTPSVPTSTTG